MVAFFSKNTQAQLMCHGFYMNLLDLSCYFSQGDYSQMLFDKVEEAFKEYDQNKEKMASLSFQLFDLIKKHSEEK